jgi:fructosamine-3-kinase
VKIHQAAKQKKLDFILSKYIKSSDASKKKEETIRSLYKIKVVVGKIKKYLASVIKKESLLKGDLATIIS